MPAHGYEATPLKVYAQMADNVYKVPDRGALMTNLSGEWRVVGHGVGEANLGTMHDADSGFKGCIYMSDNEVVVCYKGTGGGELANDLRADVKLAVGLIPREASAANSLFKNSLQFVGKRTITIVGHSLGGGLTQVVASWYSERFITFNAPPMLGCLKKSAYNIFKPQQMLRRRGTMENSGRGGRNFRVQGDPVSSSHTSVYGHYGPVHTFTTGCSFISAHSMSKFVAYLNGSTLGNQSPWHYCNPDGRS